MLNSSPVAIESAPANAGRRQSMIDTLKACSPRGTIRSTNVVVSSGIASPSMPPAKERHSASTSTCRTSRPRVAPSDSRTAYSPRRTDARARSRLARLAQAMRTMAAAAVISAITWTLVSPSTCSRIWTTEAAAKSRFVSGYCSLRRLVIASMSESAASADTPDFRRATTVNMWLPRSDASAGENCIGTQ